MKIFIDTADLAQVEKYMTWGICDGVTSNPCILRKRGIQGETATRDCIMKIAHCITPRPCSVGVTTDDLEAMMAQALEYQSWGENIVVKITITTRTGESCLAVIHGLFEQGVTVNATAVMSFSQAFLAAKAGAKYLSLFGGRIDDEGGDAVRTIAQVRLWLDRWQETLPCSPEIILGSVRTTKHIADWALAGADIITVPPAILSKILPNARTKETLAEFLMDHRP